MCPDALSAHFGGIYGSGVSTFIGGYFFMLAANSLTILIAGSMRQLARPEKFELSTS
jgi:hypothetical protein